MKRLTTITLAALTLLALTGCGVTGTPDSPTIVQRTSNGSDPYWETYRLPDGRRVSCILTNRGGISCDWTHADGADKVED